MKEVITLAMGQAGVQVSSAIWELLLAEHGISESGAFENTKLLEDDQIDHQPFFTRTMKDRYVPRTLVADLEPTAVDELRSGFYRTLFHPDNLVSGLEDAANNFARGFFTVGRLITDAAAEQIRRLMENCDHCQAFFIIRSFGGGTGSGLTSAMFDYLVDYSKTQRVELPIYPSPTLSTCIVEPYNCLLSLHFSNDDLDLSLLVDNEALYDLTFKSLACKCPTFSNLNRLIAQVINSVTSTLRFPSVLNNNLLTLQTNLVPYPRIHYPMINYAPLTAFSRIHHSSSTVMEITRAVFERDNQLVKCDPLAARYMACSLIYRGDCPPNQVCEAVQVVKSNKNIEFVDWCPTGFKMGICPQAPTTVGGSLIASSNRNVTMMCNSSCIGQALQRICHKFHVMYSKRSFVHWFVGEGMEENEFSEGLFNISTIISDYEEAVKSSDELGQHVESAIETGEDENRVSTKKSKSIEADPEVEEEEGEVEEEEM